MIITAQNKSLHEGKSFQVTVSERSPVHFIILAKPSFSVLLTTLVHMLNVRSAVQAVPGMEVQF